MSDDTPDAKLIETLVVTREAACIVITPDADGKGSIEAMIPTSETQASIEAATTARLMMLFATDDSDFMRSIRRQTAEYLEGEGKLDLSGVTRTLH